MEEEGLQEMVMERDGKFQVLLSAVDLQAEQEACREEPTATTTIITAPPDEPKHDPGTTGLQENSTTLLGDQTGSPTTSKTEDARQLTASGSTSSIVVEQDLGSTSDEARDTDASQNNKEQDDTTAQRSQSTASTMPTQTISAVRAQPLEEEPDLKPKQQIRMQSAPGLSRAAKLAQQKREAEEEQERRKKMSEAAFTAWAARKDEERKKLDRAKLKSAESAGASEKERRVMCERVYQNWVEAKNRELKSQRMLSRPTTSVPKKDEEQCRRAFESWLERKRAVQLEETKREKMKTQEMEESAKKADTSVIDKVYKE